MYRALFLTPLVFLLCSSSAPAQQSSSSAPAIAKGSSISGRVFRALGGEPLQNATVEIEASEPSQPPLRVKTDSRGNFFARNLSAGKYKLRAKRTGYAPQSLGRLLLLAAGQDAKDIVFRLQPNAVVIGKVVDEDGEPVPGVQVQAWIQKRQATGGASIGTVRAAVTNDLGEYRLYGLSAGEYFLSATDSGDPDLIDSALRSNLAAGELNGAAVAYGTTYYPNTTLLKDAVPVPVRAGEETRIDFKLQHGDRSSLTGRIFFRNGAPAADVEVMVESRDAMAALPVRFTTQTDTKGRFTLPSIPVGAYRITSRYDGEKPLIARAKVDVSASTQATADLLLAPGRTLRGRIVVEGAGLDFQSQPALVWARAMDGDDEGFGTAEIQPDGTFTIEPELPENTYRISITGLPGSYYMKSAQYGSQEVSQQGVALSPLIAADTLQITLSPEAASITGSLLDNGSPATGTTIELLADDGTTFTQSPVVTDEKGGFTFEGVAPGAYKLVEIADGLSDNDAAILGTVVLSQGESRRFALDLSNIQ